MQGICRVPRECLLYLCIQNIGHLNMSDVTIGRNLYCMCCCWLPRIAVRLAGHRGSEDLFHLHLHITSRSCDFVFKRCNYLDDHTIDHSCSALISTSLHKTWKH
jgi:hypothetical protein